MYELGSTFKIFAAAQAMELGLVNPDTMVDANAPMIWGKAQDQGIPEQELRPAAVGDRCDRESSNVGTAHIALQIGAVRQQAFLRSLGFFEPTKIELIEAAGAKPLIPARWADIVTITTSLRPRHVRKPHASGHRLCHHREWRRDA